MKKRKTKVRRKRTIIPGAKMTKRGRRTLQGWLLLPPGIEP